ncbi:MAG: hypothetical protein ABI333_30345 [bacterium]
MARKRCSRHLLSMGLGLGVTLIALSCAPKKRSYTVPAVTKEIEGGIREAQALKNKGKLKKASENILKLTAAVLKEYPQATLTQEPVKKLIAALEWMANMCLDRSLELKNESVSSEQDGLSKKFRAWSDEHRTNMSKLREMVPSLTKAEVAARRAAPKDPMTAPKDPMTAPKGPTGEPKTEPRATDPRGQPMQPAPDDPREPTGGEPSGMEP